jgi:type IV secretion system protein VirD4
MRYGGPRHVVVFGPNGTGKGMRILVPNLLQCLDRSIFVLDPKGELAAMTAPFRRTLGRVVVINPFGVLTDIRGYEDLQSTGYNPLAVLDPRAPSFNADASLLADALVTVGGKDPHWDESARALLAAIIMFVVMEARGILPAGMSAKVDPVSFFGGLPKTPTMARVRELLCLASDSPAKHNNYEGAGIPALALSMMRLEIAGLRNKASQFTTWSNEIQSIASAAKRQTEPFDDTEIAEDLAKDGFDFREMKRRPTTVYVILPPEMLARHSKWLRLVLTAAIQGVLRARGPGEPKALFMLDEFAALGHLQIIETVWALVRGYGIQIMPVFQDLTQLKGLYGERWETFVGNAGAVATFAPNDQTTAKWLAERGGETTRVVLGYHSGSSSGGSGADSASQGLNWSQARVPLVQSHSLFGMASGALLVTLAGLSNIVPAYAPGWWEIQQCRERARANPYFNA